MRIVSAILVSSVLLGCKGSEPEQQIVFAPKAFYANSYGVYVAGTLTGDDVPYKNNTTMIMCYSNHMECLATSVEQIGSNQIGRLDVPRSYPVIKWNADVVVASDYGDLNHCNKVTISIALASETAVWLTEPVNRTQEECKKNFNTKILKWTIEDSPAWKAMSRK